MELNKGEFLKTEFGESFKACVIMADLCEKSKDRRGAAWWQAQKAVYSMAMECFYGSDFFFTDTGKYFGVTLDGENDWMFKIERDGERVKAYRQRRREIYLSKAITVLIYAAAVTVSVTLAAALFH